MWNVVSLKIQIDKRHFLPIVIAGEYKKMLPVVLSWCLVLVTYMQLKSDVMLN